MVWWLFENKSDEFWKGFGRQKYKADPSQQLWVRQLTIKNGLPRFTSFHGKWLKKNITIQNPRGKQFHLLYLFPKTAGPGHCHILRFESHWDLFRAGTWSSWVGFFPSVPFPWITSIICLRYCSLIFELIVLLLNAMNSNCMSHWNHIDRFLMKAF